MDNVKQQIIEKLQNANNILVTVSANPSVDQLAACIGLTLLLNKLNKHATAVFSGQVPSTIEFLNPEETLETNTDSLRDFIISLDKAKADKLRYKVEDEVVKIFITPYKSSISEKDLIFSQGDFNVDVVMALGVREPQDLDNAITAHGRILHDAVVICVNTTDHGQLGSINWQDTMASGVSELMTTLATNMGPDLLDAQISTAFLTGIVAQTEHFSNHKTSPQTMTSSAALLAAGANQQLVALELTPKIDPVKPAEPPIAKQPAAPEAEQKEDGELDVPHTPEERTESDDDDKPADETKPAEPAASEVEKGSDHVEPLPEAAISQDPDEQPSGEPARPAVAAQAVELPKPATSKSGRIKRIEPLGATEASAANAGAMDAPKAGSAEPLTIVAPTSSPAPDTSDDEALKKAEAEIAAQLNTTSEPKPPVPVVELPPAPDKPEHETIAAHNPTLANPTEEKPVEPAQPTILPAPEPQLPVAQPTAQPQPAPEAPKTLSDLEEAVQSPHLDMSAEETHVDDARKAVEDALKGAPDPIPEPLQRAGSTEVDLPGIGHDDPLADKIPDEPAPSAQPAPGQGLDPVMPPSGAALPDYLHTPSTQPPAGNMPPYEDLASTPVPAGINVPPPQAMPPTSTTMPPQGPPPPPMPPMPSL